MGKHYYCDGCEYKWQSKKLFGEPAFCPKCKSDKIVEVKPTRKEGSQIIHRLFGSEIREVKDMGNYYMLSIIKDSFLNTEMKEIKIPKNDYEKVERYKIKEMLEES